MVNRYACVLYIQVHWEQNYYKEEAIDSFCISFLALQFNKRPQHLKMNSHSMSYCWDQPPPPMLFSQRRSLDSIMGSIVTIAKWHSFLFWMK